MKLSLLLTTLTVCSLFSSEKDFKSIRPLLESKCFKCHDSDVQKGHVQLDLVENEEDLIKQRKLWMRALEQIESDEMPPKKPFFNNHEKEQVASYLRDKLNNYDWSKIKNPGYVPISRMTIEEYKRSVSDLFGMDLYMNEQWQNDSEGKSGFKNDRDNLNISSDSMYKYLLYAENYLDALFSQLNKPFRLNLDLGKGLNLNDHRKPQSFNLLFPYSGIYQLDFKASSKGEFYSGLSITLNGNRIFGAAIKGKDKISKKTFFAEKGAAVLMFHLSEKHAPLFKDERTLFPLSEELKAKIRAAASKPPRIKVPEKFKNNQKVINGIKHLNSQAAKCYKGKMAALVLLEQKMLPDTLAPVRDLLKGNYTRAITRGKLSKAMGLSVNELLNLWNNESGEVIDLQFSSYTKLRSRYLKEFNQQHGSRHQSLAALNIHEFNITGPYRNNYKNKPYFLKTTKDRHGAVETLSHYAGRAFRKSIQDKDILPLITIYDDSISSGKDHFMALKDALTGLLLSPDFLLHQYDLDKESLIKEEKIASRLSFFLWGSLPDEMLLNIANNKKLNDPGELSNQLKRMIADDRFSYFSKNFPEEWLNLGNISGVSLLTKKAMISETGLLFHKVFSENRNIFELIDPSYTFLNELLAKHYGLKEKVSGQEMKLVPLQTKERGGLLTMGSMLASTSLSNRTSPVQRGAWIVEQILGEELPPPPEGVPELPTEKGKKTLSVRKELEIHRNNKKCSACHNRIDPFGFILENYDRLGRMKFSRGKKIDTEVVFRDGRKIDKIEEFKEYLINEKHEKIRRNIVERLLSFALGRELKYFDEPAVRKIIAKVKADNDLAHSYLEGVIHSYPFLNQKFPELTE